MGDETRTDPDIFPKRGHYMSLHSFDTIRTGSQMGLRTKKSAYGFYPHMREMKLNKNNLQKKSEM